MQPIRNATGHNAESLYLITFFSNFTQVRDSTASMANVHAPLDLNNRAM